MYIVDGSINDYTYMALLPLVTYGALVELNET